MPNLMSAQIREIHGKSIFLAQLILALMSYQEP